MKLAILSGSHRSNSNSDKVAEYLRSAALDSGLAETAQVYSLAGNPLPLWDEGLFSGDAAWKERLAPVKGLCQASDALIVIAPEWHGQVPSGLKNLFLLLDQKDVGHKPALLVSVSAGTGGTYPIAELRMSSYKNNRICYLPEHLIVRGVDNILNDDADKNDAESDAYYRRRIDWCLKMLASYADALSQVRESGVTATDEFHNGM